MNIIVPKKGSEAQRKKREAYAQIVRHYYNREVRDGARFRVKGNFNKRAIQRAYGDRTFY